MFKQKRGKNKKRSNGSVSGANKRQELEYVEKLLRLRTALASNLSHELKTPIHTMLAISSVLRNEIDGKLNEEQKRQLDLIGQHGEHLLAVISSLIDFSELEQGYDKPHPVAFSLYKLVNTISQVFIDLAKTKKVILRVEVESLPKEFYHDEVLISHILTQLLSNAVKFTPEGGNAFLQVSLKEDLYIKVSDGGIGIDKSCKSIIFDGFVQEDYKDNRQYSGLGVGLAVAKKAAELLNASITVDSVKGDGSIFEVRIPLIKNESKPKLLIVDDEASIRQLLCSAFKGQGFTTVEASNGSDALRQVSNCNPDLIILDIMMPVMDGYSFLKEARSSEWGKDVPIILMSALDKPVERAKGFDLGASDYVVKPFEFSEVFKRVSLALAKRGENGK